MAISAERTPTLRSPKSFDSLLRSVPEAVSFAKLEAETSEMAKTPEGKFTLAYLLAARNILKPVLTDTLINNDLLQPVGGYEYNPQRTIDDVGTAIAFKLAQETPDLPNFWIRSEEDARWQPAKRNDAHWPDASLFAVLDPMDMTVGIPKGNRVQTTGIAIYDKKGDIKSIGIMSLVDDGMLFIENNHKPYVYSHTASEKVNTNESSGPIQIATLTRRMHALRNLPIFAEGNGAWTQDCASGYAVLSLLDHKVDTILDPTKGQPWYEYVIWGKAAELAGLTVTDPTGHPIDTAHIMREAITKNPDESYRIPVVMSRTPEIQQRVLSLLSSQK